MLSKVIFSFLVISTSSLIALAQQVENVEVRLATATGRTAFRIGEPIRLTLSFTAPMGDYSLEHYSSKPGSSLEEVSVSPEAGVFNWSKQYMAGRSHMDDVSSRTKLSTTPTVVDLTLNDFIRFDAPGTYRVSFKTKRVTSGGPENFSPAKTEIATNDVILTIEEMAKADETTETKRLSAAIDAAKGNWQEQTRLAQQLSYLTGNPSTIEKVKRYLAPSDATSSNYIGEIRWGLYIARDRKLISTLLYDAFKDVNREVSFDLISMLVSTRMLDTVRDDASYSEEDYARVKNTLIKELADSLDRRKGIPRGAAAITILQQLPRSDPPADLLAKVRTILLTDFDSYTMFSREYLLSAYWDWLKDPSLIPSLERMLTDTKYPDYGRTNVQTTAIKHLIELDQQRAKPYVISLIRDPNTLLSDEAIDGLGEDTLPDIDKVLLEQLTKLAGARDSVRLRARALFAARYASPSIYFSLLELYRQNKDTWQYDTKGIWLGYFIKHNPQEGVEMLKEEANRIDIDWLSSLFHNATRFTFPDKAAEFFEAELVSNDPKAAATAAYVLSERGQLKHKAMIQKRLDDWVAIWRTKASQLEGPNLSPQDRNEVSLQVELISALASSRTWTLSDNERRELRSKCLIQACKYYFQNDSGQ